MYFYGARWYDTYLNRWTSPDTIIPDPQNPLDYDRYSYVRNNPVRYNDPSGHKPCSDFGCSDTPYDPIELAIGIQKDPGLRRSWGALDKEEQTVLGNAGWDEGSFNDFMIGGNAESADFWHDPLTYIEILIGVGGAGRAASTLAKAVTSAVTTTTATSSSGVVVLGRYPKYLDVAKDVGGKVFSLPAEVFDKLTPEEQWAKNQSFLDEAIANGDQFLLASGWADATANSFFYKELNYLFSVGYTLSPRGNFLIPPQ